MILNIKLVFELQVTVITSYRLLPEAVKLRFVLGNKIQNEACYFNILADFYV